MLKAENLTLNVDDEGGKKCLLNNISFQVEDGEMLVITGPNGGGKSTLAKTLIGIQTPDSGKIILDGQDITELDINHRANAGIGFAFQQPPRFKGMTVMKLLKLAAKDELSDKECCDLLTAVGLCAKDYIYRQIDGTLSGGEMKRIEIASVCLPRSIRFAYLTSRRPESICGAFQCSYRNSRKSILRKSRAS